MGLAYLLLPIIPENKEKEYRKRIKFNRPWTPHSSILPPQPCVGGCTTLPLPLPSPLSLEVGWLVRKALSHPPYGAMVVAATPTHFELLS